MKIATLLLLIKDDEVLLAMKKRGFGVGRWNGVGGKIELGETEEQALVRECQEEIGVTPTNYQKVAVHNFAFPDGTLDMQVHTYISKQWQGEPVKTEEMAPKWFKITDIPYADMWQDDIFWLPAVLASQKLKTKFTFDENDDLQDASLKVVETV